MAVRERREEIERIVRGDGQLALLGTIDRPEARAPPRWSRRRPSSRFGTRWRRRRKQPDWGTGSRPPSRCGPRARHPRTRRRPRTPPASSRPWPEPDASTSSGNTRSDTGERSRKVGHEQSRYGGQHREHPRHHAGPGVGPEPPKTPIPAEASTRSTPGPPARPSRACRTIAARRTGRRNARWSTRRAGAKGSGPPRKAPAVTGHERGAPTPAGRCPPWCFRGRRRTPGCPRAPETAGGRRRTSRAPQDAARRPRARG